MENGFKEYIENNALFTKEDKILLGVSGGIDSMVMLNLFLSQGYDIGVAHCNFSLRGDESDGDEILVRITAEKNKLDFFSIRFDTHQEAVANGESTQMAARRLRYDWFSKIASQFGYTKIAIAHNANDTVETFFINLIRGTGIKGLTGISVSNSKIVRPIMFATRDEITRYAETNYIKYRNDSSNDADKYLRNKIRHRIIPELNNISDIFSKTMLENISRISQSVEFMSSYINKIKIESITRRDDKIVINIEDISAHTPFDYVLFEVMREYGFKMSVVGKICDCYKEQSSGKSFVSEQWIALLNRGEIELQRKEEQQIKEENNKFNPINIFFPSTEECDNGMVIKVSVVDIDSIKTLITPHNIALFDADTVRFPLTLRLWEAGDSFSPLGMRGRKKVSDFLVDAKMSVNDKQYQTVLTSAGGDIIWLTEKRIDNKNKVTLHTRSVLVVELIKN